MQVKVVIVNDGFLVFHTGHFFGFFVSVSRQPQTDLAFVFVDDFDQVAFLKFSDHLTDADGGGDCALYRKATPASLPH